MVQYRRLVTTNPVFLTLVTKERNRWLDAPNILPLYMDAFRDALQRNGWRCIAWAILPDHLHWLLDPKDKQIANDSYSNLVRNFKFNMTRSSRGSWQDRFYEHTIQSETDIQRHFDYIHFNPVKHRYVPHPSQWKHSSFHYYVRQGWYPNESEFNGWALDDIPGARYDD